jgi:sugar lactone lactonase YvrE
MALPPVTSDDGPQTPPRQPRASSASGTSAPNLHHDVKPSDLLRQIVEAFGVGILHRNGLDWTEEGVRLMAANSEPARNQSTTEGAIDGTGLSEENRESQSAQEEADGLQGDEQGSEGGWVQTTAAMQAMVMVTSLSRLYMM